MKKHIPIFETENKTSVSAIFLVDLYDVSFSERESHHYTKLRLILLLILLFFSNTEIKAQSVIEGWVVNKENKPIESSVVIEISEKNDNIITTDTSGFFQIKTSSHTSKLKIMAVGYLPIFIQTDSLKKSNNNFFRMEDDPAFTLHDVEITGKRKTITTKPGSIVFDMKNTPLKDSDAFQALRFIPTIDMDDSRFSIIGKERVDVYINHRKMNISNTEIANFLKSIHVENIENIEVVYNPGSQYKGEGDFGVINITTKQREDEGVLGFLNVQLWKTHHYKEYANGSLNFNYGKFSNMLSAGAGNYSTYRNSNITTHYIKDNTTIVRNKVYDNKERNYYIDFTSDYLLNDKNILGLNLHANIDNNDGVENGMTNFIDKKVKMNSTQKTDKLNLTANLNYRYNVNDAFLHIDIDYLYDNNRYKSKYEQYFYNNNLDDLFSESIYQQNVPQLSNIYSLEMKYGNKSKRNLNYLFGVNSYYSNIEMNNKYLIQEKENWYEDFDRSNSFLIKESTNALFVELSKKWNEVLYTSIGGRLEYTHYNGEEHTQNKEFTNDYFRFLPNVIVSVTPKEGHNVSYSFSHRIYRPSFTSLNPFVQQISPIEYSVGNPFLEPMRIYSQNIRYGLKNRFFFDFNYQNSNNLMIPIQRVLETGMIENSVTNLGHKNRIYLMFSSYLNYWNDRGSLNVETMYSWKNEKGASTVGVIDYTYHQVSGSIQNNLILSKRYDWSFLSEFGFYTKDRSSFVQLPASLDFNLWLTKRIKDFKITIYCESSTYIYDKKLTTRWKNIRTNQHLKEIEIIKGETLRFGLRVSWSFGNRKVKSVEQRNTSNSEVKNRIY